MNSFFEIFGVILISVAFVAFCILLIRVAVRMSAYENGDDPEYIEDDTQEYFYLYADMFKCRVYKAGWTRVLAPNRDAADAAFRAYHPDYIAGILSCAVVYEGDFFRQTSMFKTGNYGEYEHETISLSRMVIVKKGESQCRPE